MRWVVTYIAALFVTLAGPVLAALADEKPVTIKVTVLDADGKPGHAFVLVQKWPTGYHGGGTKDDGSFSAATDVDGRPFSSGVYSIRVSTSNLKSAAETVVYIPSDRKSPVVLTLGPAPGNFSRHMEKAAAAAQGGDSAGYERSVKDAQQGIKFDEKVADDAQQAADDFARDNGLQVRDLRGVTKDIERASKLPENVQDKELLGKLYRYQAILQEIQGRRGQIESEKKQLAELKPPDKKVSILPSACPEGQSGGLLAGGINSLFGTDLAGVCDDKQPQHRDTDRRKGGDRHERDERD